MFHIMIPGFHIMVFGFHIMVSRFHIMLLVQWKYHNELLNVTCRNVLVAIVFTVTITCILYVMLWE